VVDDYGHHPTEIKATLAAARQCGYGKIHVIFQPHRYTRTRDLIDEFATAFSDADDLLVLDIYAASEAPIEGVSAAGLAAAIRAGGHTSVEYVPSFAEAAKTVASVANPGDVILTLGAGNVYQMGPLVLQELESRQPVGAAE
jgi:UDP-N-acetylmuramate--alanine ligase